MTSTEAVYLGRLKVPAPWQPISVSNGDFSLLCFEDRHWFWWRSSSSLASQEWKRISSGLWTLLQTWRQKLSPFLSSNSWSSSAMRLCIDGIMRDSCKESHLERKWTSGMEWNLSVLFLRRLYEAYNYLRRSRWSPVPPCLTLTGLVPVLGYCLMDGTTASHCSPFNRCFLVANYSILGFLSSWACSQLRMIWTSTCAQGYV